MKKLIISVLIIVLALQCAFAESEAKKKMSYGELLQKIDLIKGDGQGLNPDGTMTRQELVTLLNRMGKDSVEFKSFKVPVKATFTDVSKTNWAYKNVEFAYAKSLTKGIGDGLFGYDQPITANQFSMFILRMMNDKSLSKTEFKDSYNVLSSVIAGKTPFTIKDGEQELKRAEMFELLYKSLMAEQTDGSYFYDIALVNDKNKEKHIHYLKANQNALSSDFLVVCGEAESEHLTTLGITLLEQSFTGNKGENTLISPTSIINALAMAANGAATETQTEMEEFFGMTINDLNPFLAAYNQSLPSTDKAKLSQANAIYINQNSGFESNPEFLKQNQDIYHATIETLPFDEKAKKKINDWVKKNTDEMIDSIIDEINATAIMYLMNALAFDAEWQRPYAEYQVREEEFTKENGKKQKVEFMLSDEHQYLETSYATGFIKDYAGGDYAFVALLPNEKLTVKQCLAKLKTENISKLLSKPKRIEVQAALPKFKTEFKITLNGVLQKMGIKEAFNINKADFSKMGNSKGGIIYINKVLHKTYIAVDEKGTKAGAVTAIIMKENAVPLDYKTVLLNRPFIYMIIDKKNNMPIFAGTLMSVE